MLGEEKYVNCAKNQRDDLRKLYAVRAIPTPEVIDGDFKGSSQLIGSKSSSALNEYAPQCTRLNICEVEWMPTAV